jgi:uncharacterized repeat protein (TIGR01451 family)
MTPADAFDVGAGIIDLERAKNAGLVLDETPENFLAADPGAGGDPKTLNIASMQDSNCLGECSWSRTVTNVTGKKSDWDLSVDGPPGVEFTLSPSDKIKLDKGESATVTVTANTELADAGWNFANLNLKAKGKGKGKGGSDLHMPIAIRAVESTAPGVLAKTVDAAVAAPGEPLNYEINITNGPLAGQIDIVDTLPDEVTYVAGSGSVAIVNGTEISPLTQVGNELWWSGELDVGGLIVTPSPAPLGYLSLPGIGVGPFGCPGNCDDGGFLLNVPSFQFNGNTYSQVIWSVNGTLEAGTASLQTSSFFNQEMPDPTPPNNILAPFWTDLNMGSDGDGAEWYVAVLNVGPDQYTVYEWNNIPRFGTTSDRFTFQIWVKNTGDGGTWYTYAQLGTLGGGTVGVEDAAGSEGSSYYYNGTGTAPAIGTDLMVQLQDGGSATISFQAELMTCGSGSGKKSKGKGKSKGKSKGSTAESEAVTNSVALSNAGLSASAIATTECVDY